MIGERPPCTIGVYQNHLQLESWLLDQEDADGSSEEPSGSLVHVPSSDEEEIAALERYEQDAAASDRPLQIDAASKAWQSLRAKDKAGKDLKRAVKVEKDLDATLSEKCKFGQAALDSAMSSNEKLKCSDPSMEEVMQKYGVAADSTEATGDQDMAAAPPGAYWEEDPPGEEVPVEAAAEETPAEETPWDEQGSSSRWWSSSGKWKKDRAMQSAYQVPAEERRHLEYWTSSQWENDWWTEEQQSEQKKKQKGSKGKKRKAWLEAQFSTLKAAGRWIGDEPNPRDKQQRLEKDGRGAFIVCFIPRTPW